MRPVINFRAIEVGNKCEHLWIFVAVILRGDCQCFKTLHLFALWRAAL
jgi:hypothetical protein